MTAAFDICIVAQAGRLSYEAVLFAASLKAAAPGFSGKLIVGVPEAGPLWPTDPGISDDVRDVLAWLGADLRPFTSHHFGARYPYGNKVEVLTALDTNQPFVFFDSDTLITGPIESLPFDFDRPSASMARENTWPSVPLYGPDIGAIWQSVYNRAGVDMTSSLDTSFPVGDWERHLYFNAGWFYYRCPQTFATKMIDLMVSLRQNPPPELASQSLNPWLDQIALPAVIAGLGGGRPGPELAGLDESASVHWRALPLFYAKASVEQIAFLEDIASHNRIKKVLKQYEPFKRMIYQGRGQKVRALFADAPLPKSEKMIRNRIKRANLWMR
ncbi:MAG: hypothetical protein AAFR73_02790 [Pseudomonadota bacterium]